MVFDYGCCLHGSRVSLNLDLIRSIVHQSVWIRVSSYSLYVACCPFVVLIAYSAAYGRGDHGL